MDALPVPVNVAVVGIGADDAAMRVAIERLGDAGHRVLGKQQLAVGAPLLEVLTSFIEDDAVDIVLAVTNDADPVRAALAPMVSRLLPGFGELLRAAAFPEIGSAAMLLEGEAAQCGHTYVFVVPGTVGAVKVALEHLLIPQLDTRTRPANLASKLPRLRQPAPPPPMDEPPSKPDAPDVPGDAEILRSDAAILIQPAEIVSDEPVPAPEKVAAAGGEQIDFVKSLELHAQKIRAEKSQVGPLPTAPPRAARTQPPPLPTQPPPINKKTDAAMKADRDTSVSEAISKVEKLPAPDEPPPPRKKNETTPQQWAKAAAELEKISPRGTGGDAGSLGAASSVLAQGDRVIVIPRPRKRRTLLWLPLALAVAAGAAFVVKTQLVSGNRTASAEPPPPSQVVKVESIETVPSPTPQPPQPPHVVENEPAGSAAGGNLTALAQAHAAHHAAAPPAYAGSAADTGSAGSEAPDPRTHPNIAPESADCDEASCILEKYQRACCARYKPAEMPAEHIAPPGPPETLDKDAVKAGIAELKPAVQQCGEDYYAQGTVKITLTVNAAGHVTDATVAESPKPELGSCVAKALVRATFAKTQNGAVFTYPFLF